MQGEENRRPGILPPTPTDVSSQVETYYENMVLTGLVQVSKASWQPEIWVEQVPPAISTREYQQHASVGAGFRALAADPRLRRTPPVHNAVHGSTAVANSTTEACLNVTDTPHFDSVAHAT